MYSDTYYDYETINQEAQELMAANGGFEINDYESFEILMNRLIIDNDFLTTSGSKAGAFVKSHAGATDIILSTLNDVKVADKS